MLDRIGNSSASLFVWINFLTSVLFILINKHFYDNYDVSRVTSLTVFYLVTLFLGLLAGVKLGFITFTRLPVVPTLLLSVCFAVNALLSNYSLHYNTIGFYQYIKLLCIPLLIVVNYFYKKQSISPKHKLALYVLCLGCAIVLYTDDSLCNEGIYAALGAVCVSTLYQITADSFQSKYLCNSAQMLLYVCPIAAALLAPLSVFMDRSRVSLTSSMWEAEALIVYAAVLSLLNHISSLLIEHKISSALFQKMGQVKICSLYVLGVIMFYDAYEWKTVVGIIVTIVGAMFCSHVHTRENLR